MKQLDGEFYLSEKNGVWDLKKYFQSWVKNLKLLQ